jgi:hypothetical protein
VLSLQRTVKRVCVCMCDFLTFQILLTSMATFISPQTPARSSSTSTSSASTHLLHVGAVQVSVCVQVLSSSGECVYACNTHTPKSHELGDIPPFGAAEISREGMDIVCSTKQDLSRAWVGIVVDNVETDCLV